MTIIIQSFFLWDSLFYSCNLQADRDKDWQDSVKRWLWSWQLLFSVFSLSLSILQIAIFRLTETKIDKTLKRWLCHDNYYSVFFSLRLSILQLAIFRLKDWQDSQAMIWSWQLLFSVFSLSLSILQIAIFRLTETKIDKTCKRWLWSWQLLFSVFSLSLSILHIAIFRLTETKIDKTRMR